MNYRAILILNLVAIVLVVFGCNSPKKDYQLVLKEHITLDSVPSASGIAIQMDSAYIVGDDAAYIYKVSMKNYGYRSIHLPEAPQEYRIPKPVKQDFESAVIARYNNINWLLGFGSGTLSPHRDSLLMINLDTEEVKTYSLANLYSFLSRIHHWDKSTRNIEAATIIKDNLFLLNRGTNSVFRMPLKDLFTYINSDGNTALPPVSEQFRIELPSLNGIPALISGAATLDDHRIVFTASLEDTKDWTKDGEIFGSYIGIYDLNGKGKVETCLQLIQNNKPVIVKLESLDVISSSEKQVDIISVSDNDDGSSGIYLLQLNSN